MVQAKAPNNSIRKKKKNPVLEVLSQWQLYAMLLPAFASLVIFHFIPLYGLSIAFKDLYIGQSLWEGTWVGLKHFKRLFNSQLFGTLMTNTLTITLVSHFLLWPIPIVFALLVHNSSSKVVRKVSQTMSYIPHLLSTVVVVCIIELMVNVETGLINILFKTLGLDTVYFMGDAKYWRWIYFISTTWKSMGSSAVIYIAALASVDPQLIEAATIDGASKIKRIWHIDIPAILPTIVLLFIMSMGSMLSVGYEFVLLLQNDLNLSVSEILSTYVYKTGLQQSQFSFSTAVTLFNNVIGLFLVIASNFIAKKVGDIALF